MSEKTTYVYNYDEPRIQRLEAALEQNTKVLSDMSKELAAERARADTLAQALEPFAACAGVWDDNEKESQRVIHVSRQGVKGKPDLVLTVGDLLDAYIALLDWRTARGAK